MKRAHINTEKRSHKFHTRTTTGCAFMILERNCENIPPLQQVKCPPIRLQEKPSFHGIQDVPCEYMKIVRRSQSNDYPIFIVFEFEPNT